MIGAAGITIGGAGFSAKSNAAITGVNECIHGAVIGVHSQGTVLQSNISYRLGRSLKCTGAQEAFANDPEANAMLTKVYRKLYLVSEAVYA